MKDQQALGLNSSYGASLLDLEYWINKRQTIYTTEPSQLLSLFIYPAIRI
jgi:hypothetical protein